MIDFVRINNNENSNLIKLNDETKKIVIFNDGSIENTYTLNAEINGTGHLDIYNVVTSKKKVTLNENVDLNNQGASCEIINVLLCEDTELASHIMINHNKKNTESNFENYAIALGTSKMILDNNAKINKGCSKSVVHQKAKGLTIGEKSEIVAQPNLYIDEYDVIANHAASIGSISKDDLFYLMSRGLTMEDASKLVVLGFIKPILDKIDDENIKTTINNSFVQML